MFHYLCKVFNAPIGTFAEGDFSDKDTLTLDQTARKVHGELYHLLGFARFQKTAEGIYFSALSPRYNILSLMLPHFMNRFSSHPWAIYDIRRSFGFYHNNGTINEISLDDAVLTDGVLPTEWLAEGEKAFQKIWRQYLDAATIKDRMNTRLQARCLPKRFWPYLTEMQ